MQSFFRFHCGNNLQGTTYTFVQATMVTTKRLFILFAILCAVALLTGIDQLPLRAEEPRRAIVAMEMLLNKSFVVPKINGWEYYNKPPVFNWILAFFYWIFGSFSEWVTRLPGVLVFAAWGITHYFFSKQFIGQKIAAASALFFITSADLLFYGTINAGEIDLFFSFLTYLQVASIFYFYQRKRITTLFITSYVLCSIGVLTKGAPSLLFQALTLLGYIGFYHKRFRLLFGWQHILGIGGLVSVLVVYFSLYQQQTGEALAYLTNLLKEATQKSAIESTFWDTLKTTVIFPLNFLKLLLPWSLFIVLLFKKGSIATLKQNSLIWFGCIFTVFNLPVYWITGTLANRYVYMFIPFVLTALAWLFFAVKKESTGFFRKLHLNTILIVSIVLVSLRIVLNFTYIPHLTKTDPKQYEQHIKKCIELADGQPIYLAGQPYRFESSIELAGVSFLNATLETAPLQAYQIPYYYTKNTHTILRFKEAVVPGEYYLVFNWNLNADKMQPLYSFKEYWQGDAVLNLVKIKE
jgi:4-amino-4-deoxy-L-arabinose transferase-like glycosyltransferase